METDDFETLLLEVPELEALLLRGGSGGPGYDRTILLGAELVSVSAAKEPGHE
jgi:hypothetical protein